MSNIVPHQFGSTIIRVIDHDGMPWFISDDIRAAIGVAWLNVAEHLGDDEKAVANIKTPSGPRRVVVINLPGLYAAIAHHRTRMGKVLKRWINAELLPSIVSSGTATVLPPRPRDGLSSTSEMAHLVGMSPGKLGRRVKRLKTAKHGEWHPVVGANSDKAVEQWFWNAAGRRAVLNEFYPSVV
jgi:prophage antirepressor-like protein